MKLQLSYIDIGNVLAWIVMLILFLTKVVDFQFFILFVLLKLEFTLRFKNDI